MGKFRRLTAHIPTAEKGEPAVVYSALKRGESAIGRGALSLKYVSSGTETYHIGKRDHHLSAGQMMILPPGVPASASIAHGEAKGVCLFLLLGPAEATPEILALLSRDLPIVLSARGRPLGSLLINVTQRLEARDPIAGDTATMLRRASLSLSREIAEGRSGFEGLGVAKLATRCDLTKRADLVRAHLHAILHRNSSLAELASLCGMSPHHLSRTFKALYGVSPIGYHRQLRLRSAYRSIVREGASPARLALDLGYSDHAAFTKAFKREFGCAPSLVGC